MSWTDYHRRADALRAVMDHADSRRDGILPWCLPGVREHFEDENDLVSALVLRWHARLSGNLERALMSEPLPVDDAIVDAWRATAEQLPGVRRILDQQLEDPVSPQVEQTLAASLRKEWQQLAVAAGLASTADEAAVAAGWALEQRARAGLTPSRKRAAASLRQADSATPRADFVRRLRAALVA